MINARSYQGVWRFQRTGKYAFLRVSPPPGLRVRGEFGTLALLCVWLLIVSYLRVVEAGCHSDFPDWLMYKLAPRN